jgi:hypothetical protein
MTDRQLFGDLSVAVLLALPLLAFARPSPVHHHQSATPVAAKVATADRVPGNGRIGIL